MPAAEHKVTHEDAKRWAKRLTQSGVVSTLSAGHAAVADMLGHASWHALEQFYRHAAAASPPPPVPSPALSEDDRNFAQGLPALVRHLNATRPELGATAVTTMAVEWDCLVDSPYRVADRARELEMEEGYFADAALEKALEEATRRVHATPNHLLIEVQTEAGQTVGVLLSDEEYAQALQLAPARRKPKL